MGFERHLLLRPHDRSEWCAPRTIELTEGLSPKTKNSASVGCAVSCNRQKRMCVGKSAPSGPFTGDAALVLKKALVNGRGIEAPPGSEQGDFFDVGINTVSQAEGKRLGRVTVVEAI